MAIPGSLPKKRRGNPNWGRPLPPIPALATEFERRVTHLELTEVMYASSRELRTWCEGNRNRLYVPEWLLAEWDMVVDINFSSAA